MQNFVRPIVFFIVLVFGPFFAVTSSLAQSQLPSQSPFQFDINPERKFFSGQVVKITNVAWDMCLNLRDIGAHNGGNPDVFGCVRHSDQEWTIEGIPGKSGLFWIRNKSWPKCLNLQPDDAKNGGRPNVWDCVDHLDQSWQLASYYMTEVRGVGPRLVTQIYNPQHNMCLNLQNVDAHNGGIPNVWECVQHPDQFWYVETLSDWAAHN